MSIVIRDNQLVVSDELRGSKSPPLPRSIPARKVAVLGDLSNTGEIVHWTAEEVSEVDKLDE